MAKPRSSHARRAPSGLALLAAHAVGDFLIQTDWQAANKATSWRANQAHVATYHAALGLVVLRRPWRRALSALALSWAAHSLVDRRWPTRRLLEAMGAPAFAATPLGILAADQALHLVTLAVVEAVAGAQR